VTRAVVVVMPAWVSRPVRAERERVVMSVVVDWATRVGKGVSVSVIQRRDASLKIVMPVSVARWAVGAGMPRVVRPDA
jgi:hypothetical protein